MSGHQFIYKKPKDVQHSKKGCSDNVVMLLKLSIAPLGPDKVSFSNLRGLFEVHREAA